MVDVDRRPSGPNPAHLAGLRRLSARAASVSAPTVRNSLHSFSALSDKVITHLRNSGIQLQPPLSDADSHSPPPLLKKQRSVAEKHSAKCPFPAFSRRSLDAAVHLRRGASPPPKWVEGYMGQMGSVLREGGWSESDISEMVSGSGSDVVLLDNEGLMDALVSKAERFSDSLRKSGWSSEEVSDAFGLGFDLRPQLLETIGKPLEPVSRS